MKTDDEDQFELPEAEAPAPAKPAKPAKKATPRKPAVKAKVKATPKAAVKAKGKARAKPVRDPAKLDAFGFRKGTIKFEGCRHVRQGQRCHVGGCEGGAWSVQFNLLTELEDRGFNIGKVETKNAEGRAVTRYKISAA